jgi:LPS export ABC transporter protein LptC
MARLTIFYLLSCLFFACENSIEKINLVTSSENLPIESSVDIEIMYSDSGMLTMKIKAPKMDRYANDSYRYTEFTQGIEVLFYDALGEVSSSIRANYAIDYEDEKRMEAKENVEVINVDGDKLNTEHLIWYSEEKRFLSEVFVKITTKDEILYGDGLDANEDFTKYTIKNIKGIIKISDNENDNE